MPTRPTLSRTHELLAETLRIYKAIEDPNAERVQGWKASDSSE